MEPEQTSTRQRTRTPGIRVTYTGIRDSDRKVVRAGRPVHEATRRVDERSADADGDIGPSAD